MSIPVSKLREIIKQVCGSNGLGLWSPVAEELLVLTAAHESHMGHYTRQVNGPALGIYQMEPATLQDLYDNCLTYRPVLKSAVDRWRWDPLNKGLESTTIGANKRPVKEALEHSIYYATAVARVQYFRFREPLPPGLGFEGLYAYYKRYWNTLEGRATYEKVRQDYFKYVVEAEANSAKV